MRSINEFSFAFANQILSIAPNFAQALVAVSTLHLGPVVRRVNVWLLCQFIVNLLLVRIGCTHNLLLSQHSVLFLELGNSAVHQVILLWLREILQEIVNLLFTSSVRERLQFGTSGADSAHVISFEIDQAF